MLDSVIISVHSLLTENLPVRNSKTPGGWVTFDCVMCTDKRSRAGIIAEGARISYNCFNCGFKTGWSPAPFIGKKYKELAIKMGATAESIHAVQIELLKNSEELENAETDTKFYVSSSKFKEITYPENAIDVYSLAENNELVQYAKRRGLYGLTPLMHFPDIVNNKRLIVPFFYDNNLVGWTGRHINPPNKQTAKYLHNLPQGFVFNIDKFLYGDRSVIIVTEGVFDAILVDGVSILGNTVSAEQAHLLEKLNKRIIVCPDRDTAGKELIKQSIALGWEVSFPPWGTECKDAADACAAYGRLATVSSIIKHATNNDIKKKVLMEIKYG